MRLRETGYTETSILGILGDCHCGPSGSPRAPVSVLRGSPLLRTAGLMHRQTADMVSVVSGESPAALFLFNGWFGGLLCSVLGLPGNPGFFPRIPFPHSPDPGWRPLEPQPAFSAAGDSGGWHLASRRGCGQRAGRTGRYPRDHCLQRQGSRGQGGLSPAGYSFVP